MPMQTQTSTQATQVTGYVPVEIPSGDRIYDALMAQIEPELVRENLEKLDAPYLGETAEERKARYQRYSAAFKAYEVAFKAWAENLKKAVKEYKSAVIKAAEKISLSKENKELENLEAQMSAL